MRRTLTKKECQDAYKVLVEECGVVDYRNFTEDYFICEFMSDSPTTEWRMRSDLGFGGTFYNDSAGIYVDCYSEDANTARKEMIKAANTRLSGLFNSRYLPA